jgi:acetyl-CoA/propionyl-CoA carboxylase, biotin carboxylase, biotin carboxyl carrier protein
MKMEHQLLAPLEGKGHLTIRPGDLVKAGQVLATIHPEAAAEQPHDEFPNGEGA